MPSRKARRDYRLNSYVIPATRLAGLAVVTALIPLHNSAVFGNPAWAATAIFAVVANIYGLGSWLLLKNLFKESRSLHLGVVFLSADVWVLLLAIHLSGGPKSWLFFLLAGRTMDQIVISFRRVVWFNHFMVASYALYLAAFADAAGTLNWPLQVAKLALLYAFNWYCSLSARTVESLRTRNRTTELAQRAKIEFTGKLSHAIRNKASSSQAALDLLQCTELQASQRKLAAASLQFNRELMNLITQLESGGEDAGAMTLENVPFSPSEVLREVQDLMQPLAARKGIGLRVEIERGTPGTLRGDRALVRQALLNLADNAVKFTSVGFVELRVWPASAHLVGFQVRDTGAGIPAHIQSRLAAPLLRADGSAWYRSRGPQVGLTVTKQMVESMGGALQIAAELGKGSTLQFVLHLPSSGRPAVELSVSARAGSGLSSPQASGGTDFESPAKLRSFVP